MTLLDEEGFQSLTRLIDDSEIIDRIFDGRIRFEDDHIFQRTIDLDLIDDLIDLTIVTNEIMLFVVSTVKET